MVTCVTGCGRPTRGTLALCEQCTWEIKQALDVGQDKSIPALLDDLATTLTRQARITQRNGSRSAESPVPFHIRASDIATHARGVLVGWVRVLAGDNPDRYPSDTLPAICDWLLRRTSDMAMHEAAADIHDEITDTAARIHHVIDRPADRLYAGVCGTSFAEQHTCGEPLYAHPGAAVVRCVDCGTVHEVTKRRDDMLRRLDDRLVTASEFARLATYLIEDIGRSREQTRKLVNQWHSRGLLERHSDDRDGNPLFVFADVKILLARDQARRDQRELEKQAV
jgi:hypothetical protein